MNTNTKQKITIAQAVEILNRNGVFATPEQAEKILDFMYILAKLAVHQCFNEKKD